MRWFVDAMNVIGTRPDGWWRDREAAMARLVDLLERWACEGTDEVIVVFERPAGPLSSTTVEVAHAPRARPDSADDEIVRRIVAEPADGAVRVVTSDRRLAERVRAAGATVESSERFRRRLER